VNGKFELKIVKNSKEREKKKKMMGKSPWNVICE